MSSFIVGVFSKFFLFLNRVPLVVKLFLLLYVYTFAVLFHAKREPTPSAVSSIIFLAMIVLVWLVFDEYTASASKLLCRKKWFVRNLFPRRGRRAIIIKSYSLSNLSMFFGALAFLSSLSKLPWVLSSFLFTVQILLSIVSFCAYFYKYHNKVFLYKWSIGIGFTFITSLVGIISNILSRQLVSLTISVPAERLPTVTSIIYWYIFILLSTYVVHFFVMIFTNELGKRKRIYFRSTIISFSIMITSLSIAGIMFVNGIIVINYLISVTYKSDTVPYFRCYGHDRSDTTYSKKAGYLNIGLNEYRMIYEEGSGELHFKNIVCENNTYVISDIGT